MIRLRSRLFVSLSRFADGSVRSSFAIVAPLLEDCQLHPVILSGFGCPLGKLSSLLSADSPNDQCIAVVCAIFDRGDV